MKPLNQLTASVREKTQKIVLDKFQRSKSSISERVKEYVIEKCESVYSFRDLDGLDFSDLVDILSESVHVEISQSKYPVLTLTVDFEQVRMFVESIVMFVANVAGKNGFLSAMDVNEFTQELSMAIDPQEVRGIVMQQISRN